MNEYLYNELKRYGNFRPIRILADVLVIVCLVLNIIAFLATAEATILSYVTYLMIFSYWATMLFYIAMNLLRNVHTDDIHNRYLEIPGEMNETLSQENDWILLLMEGFLLLMTGSNLYIIYVKGANIVEVSLIGYILIGFKLMSLAATKHIIAKRLRYIRTAEEYMDRAEDTISHTRQLLECNTRLNNTYAPLALSCTVNAFQTTLYFTYTIWVIYGTRGVIHGTLANDLIPSLLVVVPRCLLPLVCAYFASNLTNEVEEVKLELDITMCARPCTENQERLILLFLMELHHTPTQLSALGLFDINLSLVSTVCATAINYLLVLITYTK